MVKLPKGFFLKGIRSGITKNTKQDLGIIYSEVPAVSAGVFTRNKVKAAPVLVSLKHASNGKAQAIVANSGCANACTGKKGMTDALNMAGVTADILKVKKDDVIVASTGCIGSLLPMDKIKTGIRKLGKDINSSNCCHIDSFVKAIMTTDTVSKIVSRQFTIGKKTIILTGIAKGAGMICPDMATMLCFLITDVKITRSLLKRALKSAVDDSFNMLTVDGDTSTNDMVVVLANGLAQNRMINKDNSEFSKFSNYLKEITLELARMIASDGEGATKFLQVTVEGAGSFSDAKKVAFAIADSTLVKTAMFGMDPNWGRIIVAVGSAGVQVNSGKIDIYLASIDAEKVQKMIKLVNNGCQAEFREKKAKTILKNKKIGIIVDLKRGKQKATVFSCDLSIDYVKINADYRT